MKCNTHTPERYRCKDCKQLPEIFMLLDSMWDSIADTKRDILCVNCCELRLGRRLNMLDFDPDISCNQILFYTYALGLDRGREEMKYYMIEEYAMKENSDEN